MLKMCQNALRALAAALLLSLTAVSDNNNAAANARNAF